MACNFSEPYEGDANECQHEYSCQEETDLLPIHSECKNFLKVNPELMPAIEKSSIGYRRAVERCTVTIQSIANVADENQRVNTKALDERAKQVSHWRGELQALISKLRDEMLLLDNLRKQVEKSLTVLQIPEAINSECKSRRTCRTGYDMVPDPVDQSLSLEEQLCHDIRDVLTRTKADIISQLKTNNVCKVQLEYDWSDKHAAYQLEATNVGLRENGPIAFFPGATRLPSNQSTPEHWIHYTKELICQGNDVLKNSQVLRGQAEHCLSQAIADLRAQANSVDLSFHKNISATEHALHEAELNLTKVQGEITTAETLHGKLENMARQVDLNMKISQTRLQNRSKRPGAEQTRDTIQYNLIEEVSKLNSDGCAIKGEMNNADATLQLLYKSRALLEDTIAVKRKSLYIDRDRCLPQRNKFPDSAALLGV